MSYHTLVISQCTHDSSIALFRDDELIFFIASERETRKKHDTEVGLKTLKQITNITKKIDLLILGGLTKNAIIWNNVLKSNGCIIDKIVDLPPERPVHFFDKQNVMQFSHHDIHAISGFYMSDFNEAICLVIDGMGSTSIVTNAKKSAAISLFETTSIIEISENYSLTNLYKQFFNFPLLSKENDYGYYSSTYGGISSDNLKRSLKKDYPDVTVDISNHFDIGQIYGSVTRFLSFDENGCGKTMGLSGYGNPENKLPKILIGDTCITDNNLLKLNREIDCKVYPELESQISEQQKADFAFNVQRALEKIFLKHAEFIYKKSKIRNLVISGGCALNILGISAIKRSFPEFNIFVDPIAMDATQAIGTGIHLYNHIRRQQGSIKKETKFNSIYLGPEYNLETTESKIRSFIRENDASNLKPI